MSGYEFVYHLATLVCLFGIAGAVISHGEKENVDTADRIFVFGFLVAFVALMLWFATSGR